MEGMPSKGRVTQGGVATIGASHSKRRRVTQKGGAATKGACHSNGGVCTQTGPYLVMNPWGRSV